MDKIFGLCIKYGLLYKRTYSVLLSLFDLFFKTQKGLPIISGSPRELFWQKRMAILGGEWNCGNSPSSDVTQGNNRLSKQKKFRHSKPHLQSPLLFRKSKVSITTGKISSPEWKLSVFVFAFVFVFVLIQKWNLQLVSRQWWHWKVLKYPWYILFFPPWEKSDRKVNWNERNKNGGKCFFSFTSKHVRITWKF